MSQILGILGGMGPRATVTFEQMLIERFNGSDQELPTIVSINDGQIPDRSDYILKNGKDPLPRLQNNLKLLEQMGASIICIPCNTACTPPIFSRLSPTGSKIINLPLETVELVVQQRLKNVYLLASEGTIASGIYQKMCNTRGVNCIIPNKHVQSMVSAVIGFVKMNNKTMAVDTAKKIALEIEQKNCDAIILGCTELPLIINKLVPKGYSVIDTLVVLADACVGYTGKEL